MNNRVLYSFLITCLLGLASCRVQEHVVDGRPGQGFRFVFDGFVYVGTDVDRNSHSRWGTPLPERIVADHVYVFHHERPFDEVEFARRELPIRLEKEGFLVTKPVDAGQGFIAAGPVAMWSVQFSGGQCRGSIGNQTCLDLTRKDFLRRLFKNTRWEESDYLLSLKGQCNE